MDPLHAVPVGAASRRARCALHEPGAARTLASVSRAGRAPMASASAVVPPSLSPSDRRSAHDGFPERSILESTRRLRDGAVPDPLLARVHAAWILHPPLR